MRVSDDKGEVFAGKVRGEVCLRMMHHDFLDQTDHAPPLDQSWLKWQRYKPVPSWSVPMDGYVRECHFIADTNQTYLRFDAVL
jgi:hypothetical protein